MNKLPNVSRGGFNGIINQSAPLFAIPDDALPPAMFYFRNVDILGSIFVKVGADVTDSASDADFHYVFLPGEEKYIDNPGTGYIHICSDQAAGVHFSWNVRYTTASIAVGANVS